MPYSVLGPGMLNAIDEAAKLVKREARIVPGSVKVVGSMTHLLHSTIILLDNVPPIHFTLVSHSTPPLACAITLRGRSSEYWQLSVQVRAQLLDMRVTSVSGFDLAYLNRYRWGCAAEKVDLSRSDPFLLH